MPFKKSSDCKDSVKEEACCADIASRMNQDPEGLNQWFARQITQIGKITVG